MVGHFAMMCDHANEVPNKCTCPKDCYCKTHTCKLKPNGMPVGTFIISIDDGYVEYKYEVTPTPRSKHLCIDSMYKIIRQALRAKKSDGLIRHKGE